ncbi:hypothetical protein Tco_0480240 [Tanacetum coccineum]
MIKAHAKKSSLIIKGVNEQSLPIGREKTLTRLTGLNSGLKLYHLPPASSVREDAYSCKAERDLRSHLKSWDHYRSHSAVVIWGSDFVYLGRAEVTKLTTGRLVNGSSCDGIDMVIKNLDLEPKVYAMMRDFLDGRGSRGGRDGRVKVVEVGVNGVRYRLNQWWYGSSSDGRGQRGGGRGQRGGGKGQRGGDRGQRGGGRG